MITPHETDLPRPWWHPKFMPRRPLWWRLTRTALLTVTLLMPASRDIDWRIPLVTGLMFAVVTVWLHYIIATREEVGWELRKHKGWEHQ